MPSYPMWLPLPPPRRPSGVQRCCALLALLAALAGAAATLVVWRADAAAREGNYARAVWWRPGVPMYHRELGETLLLTLPAQAEQQYLTALRLDPYDPLTIADLTTAELALGNWPSAVNITHNQQGREPGFDDYWRLANLFLAHGDLGGFWQQMQIAAGHAEDSYYPSIVSRALTASGYDFPALRRALPGSSVAAASAFVAAATEQGNRSAALSGAAWLLGLPPAAAGSDAASARRQAVSGLIEAAWRHWPNDVTELENEAVKAGEPTGSKQPTPPYLANGEFNPSRYSAARVRSPNPADLLSALLGWGWGFPAGVRFDPVYTGDVMHPTAAEFRFDGSEYESAGLTQQWILAPGSTRLAVRVWSRSLASPEARPAGGVSLQLSDAGGHVMQEIGLNLAADWTLTEGSFTTPAGPLGAYIVSLHYQRPLGQLLLNSGILVTGVELQ